MFTETLPVGKASFHKEENAGSACGTHRRPRTGAVDADAEEHAVEREEEEEDEDEEENKEEMARRCRG